MPGVRECARIARPVLSVCACSCVSVCVWACSRCVMSAGQVDHVLAAAVSAAAAGGGTPAANDTLSDRRRRPQRPWRPVCKLTLRHSADRWQLGRQASPPAYSARLEKCVATRDSRLAVAGSCITQMQTIALFMWQLDVGNVQNKIPLF